ncbi:MAG: peptidylprolyl isomerase [Chthoniobacterales bacterium]
MKKVLFCILLLLLGALPAPAANLGPDVAVVLIKVGREKVARRVVIGFYDQATPQTVANFKELIRRKFYNGLRFHRVFPNSMVQTGDPYSRWGESDKTGTGGPGYTIPAEIGGKISRGSLTTSRLPDDINPARASSGSQFYFALRPLPSLDGKNTVFGEVLEGIEVLDAISNETTDSNDFPVKKIVIKSITLEPRGS